MGQVIKQANNGHHYLGANCVPGLGSHCMWIILLNSLKNTVQYYPHFIDAEMEALGVSDLLKVAQVFSDGFEAGKASFIPSLWATLPLQPKSLCTL